MLTGLVLFSHMARLHPRYVEGFTPAVAALLGIGLAWATAPRGRLRLAALIVAMVVTVYYAERLLFGTRGGLVGRACWVRSRASRSPLAARWAGAARAAGWLWAATLAGALVAVLAVGVKTDIRRSATRSAPRASSGSCRATCSAALSSYLHAHNQRRPL